jgi:site-specific recombinase XerD
MKKRKLGKSDLEGRGAVRQRVAMGWHTMRHTYRSWLDDTGAPMTVQQNLWRHASMATTARYGDAIPDTLREAHGKVVRMVIQ